MPTNNLHAIMVKGDDYSKEIRNQHRKIVDLQRSRKNNRDKNVDRRLHALVLHAESFTDKKISEITGYNEKYLYALYRKYLAKGHEGIAENNYSGNHRNMSYEEESELLAQFIDETDGGRITDVSAIKAAYDKKIRTRDWTWTDTMYCIGTDGKRRCPETSIRRVRTRTLYKNFTSAFYPFSQ